MSVLHCRPSFLSRHPVLEDICEILGKNLGEENVYLVQGVYTDYEIRFDDNSTWFKLDHVIEKDDEHTGFYIELMVNNLGVWNNEYRNETMRHFNDTMFVYAGSGFPDGGKGFMWKTTKCPYQAIDVGTDAPQFEEDWGDGSDLEDIDTDESDSSGMWPHYVTEGMTPIETPSQGVPAGQSSPGFDKFKSLRQESAIPNPMHADDDGSFDLGDFDDDDETPVPAGVNSSKFSNTPRPVPSIVPDGINQIRIVALKYNGALIAFRFKTNVGAFDMRREVAAKFGFGDFKTEKFIALQNVNGMLMSESERKRHVCVPDVSECKEDCQRLADALFGS